MATNYVDPISRIEGHLGVDLEHTGNEVTEANLHGNLWRGFENFLIGREPNDAITFTQRICGVCPVPHGQAATFAVEAAMGYNDNFHTFQTTAYAVGSGKGIPAKAILIRNLILSSEFLMSSITHFYHLAAPSYVQGPATPPWTPYFNDNFYNASLRAGAGGGVDGKQILPTETLGFSNTVWSAVIKSYVKALRIRRLTFEAGALFAGRMPMTSSFIAGGVTNDAGENLTVKVGKFRLLTEEVGRFVLKEYVPISLALSWLYPTYDNVHNTGQAGTAGLGYGGGCGNMLAWGAFPEIGASEVLAIPRGYLTKADVLANNAATAITVDDVLNNLREHITYSRYASASEVGNATDITDPSKEDRTIPLRTDSTKYSWMKAPRWAGRPMEVGPMARMFVMGVFKDNVPLSISANPAGMAGYASYVKNTGATVAAVAGANPEIVGTNTGGTLGLDPKMIEPDVAVALLLAGLAALNINGTIVTNVANLPATRQGIIDAYTNTGAGALGEAVITDFSGVAEANGLIGRIFYMKSGLSTMDRLRGRAIESLYLVQKMVGAYDKATDTFTAAGSWCAQLGSATGTTYVNKAYPVGETFGFGGHEAPRGALMHMCTQTAGKITAYQCIVPTTWNGSPKGDNALGLADPNDDRGPIEEAMIGIPYSTTDTKTIRNQANTADIVTQGGVEALRVAQSFDPCIACAIH